MGVDGIMEFYLIVHELDNLNKSEPKNFLQFSGLHYFCQLWNHASIWLFVYQVCLTDLQHIQSLYFPHLRNDVKDISLHEESINFKNNKQKTNANLLNKTSGLTHPHAFYAHAHKIAHVSIFLPGQ